MRRSTLPPTLLLAAATLAASPAAALLPFYVVGKLGNVSADVELGDVDRVVDGDDNYWSFGVGARLGRRFSIQAEYHDLGSLAGRGGPCRLAVFPCPDPPAALRADTTGYSLSILPRIPLKAGLGLYGKLGLIAWDADIEVLIDDPFGEEIEDDELLAGLGLDWRLPGPFHLLLEYERIGDSFEAISLGASLEF